MSPLPPINAGASGASARVPAPATNAAARPTQGAPTTATGTSQSILNVSTEVTQFLNGVGGGMEDNKVIKTLISLLILMALLDRDRSQQEGLGAMLALLGQDQAQRSSGGDAGWSVSFEVSRSETVVLAMGSNSQETGRAFEPPATGGNVDVVG